MTQSHLNSCKGHVFIGLVNKLLYTDDLQSFEKVFKLLHFVHILRHRFRKPSDISCVQQSENWQKPNYIILALSRVDSGHSRSARI